MKIFQFLLSWSEVWALLIPLTVILVYKPKGPFIKWLTAYVILAFLSYFLATFINECSYLIPKRLSHLGNNIFYNFHSFIMVVFFSYYLINVRKYKYPAILKGLIVLYLLFVLVNFIFWDPVLLLSIRHFTVGSIVLLLICLSYFFRSITEESQTNWLKHPSFIICTGLFFYQAITFFIFLFLYPLFDKSYNKDVSFALFMMKVYQVIFVAFCITLAFGLYKYKTQQNKSAML